MAALPPIEPRSPARSAAEISPAQIRAARAMLDWTLRELAARACLPAPWVAELERGRRFVSAEVLAIIRFVFEDAGIRFVGEPAEGLGVTLGAPHADAARISEDLGRRLGFAARSRRRSAGHLPLR
jgi:transcriptional regulator with XRE-family HTH domain